MSLSPDVIDSPTDTLGPPAAAGHYHSTVIAPSSLTPEEQLNRGIIHTDISRRLAATITIVFIVLVSAIPVIQTAVELHRRRGVQALVVFRQTPTPPALHAYEKDLEKASIPRNYVQPRAQWVISRYGGFGNSKGVIGRDGWLFYQPGLDYLMGPGVLDPASMYVKRKDITDSGKAVKNPDPRPAILQFDRQCREIGARLVLVPIPDKAMMQPAQLTRRMAFSGPQPPPNNPDFERLIAELRAQGVDVFYPSPATISPGENRFLIQDTHWSPTWMQQVAQDLTAYVGKSGIKLAQPIGNMTAVPMRVSRVGDLVDMLKLPEGQRIFPPQTVDLRRIEVGKGEPWQPRHDAEILLLGDSFTNIFSVEAMGWGDSAGFAEQLSYNLRRPVDRISRNASVARATRQMLSTELARGRNRLAGKKLVIWEFAIREFQIGEWSQIDMKYSPAAASRFIVPKPGETWQVTGTIESITLPPRPGSVPYKDHIVAMHLTDLQSGDHPSATGGQALVYLWSMRNNVWTDAAHYRPDQKVTLRLRPWSDVSGKLEAINRRDLDDDAINLEEPCWGEEVK